MLFVTHDINAVLDYVDQVLYLAAGQFRLGTPVRGAHLGGPDASCTGRPSTSLHAQGRLIVVASNDPSTVYHLSEDDNCAVDHGQPDSSRRSRHVMSIWDRMFNFDNYGELLALLQNSIIAGALLGLIGGLIGVFVMMRDLTFAVHGISELSFAGASFALLVGFNVVIGSIMGSLIAALVIGVLGVRARERSSIIGVLMPFGLGLGVLFLALYPGRSANKFGLLTGQIVAVDDPQLLWMVGVTVVVLARWRSCGGR